MSFNYIESKIICFGKTLDELMEELKFYLQLLDLSKEEGILLLMKKWGVSEDLIDGYREQIEYFKKQSGIFCN